MDQVLLAGLPDGLADWLRHRLGRVSVRAVASGAQALQALEEQPWSVLVVDDSLRRPTASELLMRLRATPTGTRPDLVYCQPAAAAPSDSRRLIEQLGVTQLLHHPLDTDGLACQIARLLGRPLPARESGEQAAQLASVAVAKIWSVHRDAILGQVAVLEQAAAAASGGTLDDDLRLAALREAHRLAGTAGTFGFADASVLARELENALQSHDTAVSCWPDMVSTLRGLLEGAPVMRNPAEPPADDLPLFLVVNADPLVAGMIAVEGMARGIRVRSAADSTAAREQVARELPDIVLLELSRDLTAADAALLAELADTEPAVPVLVLAGRSFTDRAQVARLGGRGFLELPRPPADLLDAAAQMIDRLRSGDLTVLALDDDPGVLSVLQVLLQPHGMRLEVTDDPLGLIATLARVKPDLLVLDVDMPYLSGIELCRMIRNDPVWADLPVLFLTAYSDRDTVHRVFAAGADDYVTKPIVGPELVTRITNRLERIRLYRSLAETDALTGVANRRKADQLLEQFLRLSDRFDQSLSLALLDLDHFKQVNDRYGHAAGDEVLRRLGALLQEAFRSEDVVARLGGEEFIVGMYGMRLADGQERLHELLSVFRQEVFSAPDSTTFHVTFSAGIVQYPLDGTDGQALYRAADEALYHAKRSGRDRVFASSPGQAA